MTGATEAISRVPTIDTSAGRLSFVCNELEELQSILNDEKVNIISSVFIKNMPLEFIAKFKSKLNKNNISDVRFVKATDKNEMDFYDLVLKDYTNFKTFKITICFINEARKKYEVEVCHDLKIYGLKKQFKKIHGNKSSLTEYFLYLNRKEQVLLCDNDYTLSECGINEEETLELSIGEREIGLSPLQGGTLNTYETIEQFYSCFYALSSRIDIVCHIINENTEKVGTGFLIGKNLIMTNAHVVPGECKGFNAVFFYNNNLVQALKFPLVDDIISSKSPGKFENVTRNALDIKIIKFEIRTWNIITYAKMYGIFGCFGILRKARSFFDGKNRALLVTDKKRANIIQHPTLGDENKKKTADKMISYRETLMHSKPEADLEFHYTSSTFDGSSGAPFMNDKGQFLGVHRTACFRIEKLLMENRELLFEKLKEYLGKCEPEGANIWTFSTSEWKFRILIVAGKTEWEFYKENEKPLSFIGFINLYCKSNPYEWAWNFLKEHKKIAGCEPFHKECNVGIVADRIFDEIEEQKKDKIKSDKYKAAQQFSIYEFQPFIIPAVIIASIVAGVRHYRGKWFF